MRSCFLIFISLIITSGLNSQTQHKTYSFLCSVRDIDGQKISNTVLTKKYFNSTEESQLLSSFDFKFTFSDTSNIQYISISHVSYESFYITKKEMQIHCKSNPDDPFNIVLKPKVNNLEEVDIRVKKPFYQNENLVLIDYEILNNGNLILLTQRQIYLLNSKDSILKIIPNDVQLENILRSCSGKIYFLNNRFLYSTYIDNNNLLLSKNPVNISESEKQLSEIIACDSFLKIKEKVKAFNQVIVYSVQFNHDLENEIYLYVVSSKEMLELAKAEYTEITNETVPDRMGYITPADLAVIRAHDQKVWKYEFFTTKKPYAPLFITRDSIYIFDYAIQKVTVFKYSISGKVVDFKTLLTKPLLDSKKEGWMGEIIQDYYTKEMFAVYRDKAIRLEKLCYFNEPAKTLSLPTEHFFAHDIKVYNNIVYYLWRDPSKPSTNKTIYKR